MIDRPDTPPYDTHRRTGCGCCTGDGSGVRPENDRCTCWLHQDTPNGVPPKVCAYHRKEASDEK